MAKLVNNQLQNPVATLKSEQMQDYSGLKIRTTRGHSGVEVDGYRERFGPDNSEATRVFDVPWNKRGEFKDAMLGYSYRSSGLKRYIPDQHPEFPWLYARDVELMNGIGAVTQTDTSAISASGSTYTSMIAYVDGTDLEAIRSGQVPATTQVYPGLARYRVTYRSLPYDVFPDDAVSSELERYVERRPAYAIQALPINNFQIKFINGDKDPVGAATKLFPTMELAYVWHEVPDPPPWDAIEACIGCVNDDLFDQFFDSSGVPFGAGTLLCLVPAMDRKRGPAGRMMWTITYKFLYRPQGHNYFPRIGIGANNQSTIEFVKGTILGDPAADGLYLKAHFDDLFDLT